MSKRRSDYLKDSHNKGQGDGAQGKYKNPHNNPIDAFLGLGSWDPERADQYDKGFKKGKEDRKRGR